MPFTFRATPEKAAIWSGTGDEPFVDPANNVDRLHWHSELRYPKIVGQFTFTQPSVAVYGATQHGQYAPFTYKIGDHGQLATPVVFGEVNIDVGRSSLCGTVPFGQQLFRGLPSSRVWMMVLEVDDTSIYLTISHRSVIWPGSVPAFNGTVYITDETI